MFRFSFINLFVNYYSPIKIPTLQPPVKEICPLCRTEVLHKKSNCQLSGIIETFVASHPTHRRPQREIEELDAKEERYTREQKAYKKKNPGVGLSLNSRLAGAGGGDGRRASAACCVI